MMSAPAGERGETHAIKRVLTFTALALTDREADHCHAVHHDAPRPAGVAHAHHFDIESGAD
jgi:hypothetical protein